MSGVLLSGYICEGRFESRFGHICWGNCLSWVEKSCEMLGWAMIDWTHHNRCNVLCFISMLFVC